MSVFSILNHHCSFMVYYYLFGVFYLGKLLLSGFLQLKGKIIWHITVTLYSISYRNYHKTTMKTRFFSSILTSFFRQQHVGFFRSHNNISPVAGPSPSRSTCYITKLKILILSSLKLSWKSLNKFFQSPKGKN